MSNSNIDALILEVENDLEATRVAFVSDPVATQQQTQADVDAVQNDKLTSVIAQAHAMALLRHAFVLTLVPSMPEACACYKAAEIYAQRVGAEIILLYALGKGGRALQMSGETAAALENLQKCQKLARQIGALRFEANCLYYMGFIYAQQDKPDLYLSYTKQALVIYQDLQDDSSVASSICNIGGALSRLKRYEEASVYYEKLLPLAEKIKSERHYALYLSGVGGVLCEQGELEKGEEKIRESNAIFLNRKEYFQLTRQTVLLGRYLVEAGQYERALPVLIEAKEIAECHNFEGESSIIFDLLSRAYEPLGSYALALQMLRQHVHIRQKLNDRRHDELILNLQVKHRIEAAQRDAERAREQSEELREALKKQKLFQRELEALASTDMLTGLHNRRYMTTLMLKAIENASKNTTPIAIAILDIDNFKSINDGFGHAIGDEVLVEVAARMLSVLRTEDSIARWGGEEFCLLLIETHTNGALQAAERIRMAIKNTPIATQMGPIQVTISIGISGIGEGLSSLDLLLSHADKALYQAKHQGRDRVVWL